MHEPLNIDSLIVAAKRFPKLPLWVQHEFSCCSGMLGIWQKAYGEVKEPYAMLGDDSYHIGMQWLKGEGAIADWGCGPGYAKRFCPEGQEYVGIDGSPGPHTTLQVDLRRHITAYPNIFCRHVLEHNIRWQELLQNILSCFTRRMSLVTFLPLRPYTQLADAQDEVPYLHLSEPLLRQLLAPYYKSHTALPDGQIVWHLAK